MIYSCSILLFFLLSVSFAIAYFVTGHVVYLCLFLLCFLFSFFVSISSYRPTVVGS